TYLSFNYYRNQGIQKYTGFQRLSLRVNSEYDVINDHLTIGENLSLSHMKINDQNQAHYMLVMPPIIPVHTIDGGWGGTAYSLGMDDYNNPVRILAMNKDNDRNFSKVLGNVFANLTLFDRLNLKTQFGIDYTTGYYRHIDFTWQEGGGKQDVNNGIRQDQFHTLNWTWSNTLTLNMDVGQHEIDFLAGIEA